MSLIFASIATGFLDANCGIIGNPATGNFILTDVGGSVDEVLQKAGSMGLTNCTTVFFTHGHLDHIGGAAEVKKRTGARLLLHEKDVDLYNKYEMQCRQFGLPYRPLVPLDGTVKEGDTIEVDGVVGRVIHTPGHSPGSSCLYFPSMGLLINGDTLFQGSYGRTDLWGGNMAELRHSIKTKLFTLPDDTKVIAGHGGPTTIGREKRSNLINY